MECNERNTMSKLRIIELEQQLKRRDERLSEIEAKVNALQKYDVSYEGGMGLGGLDGYYSIEDVIEAFK